MSSIHYKFKAMLDYKTLIFDGLHISGIDLKRQICEKESIKADSFDLILTNAHTKRQYSAEELIPRNSSVIVQRIPCENAAKLPKIQDNVNSGIIDKSGAGPEFVTHIEQGKFDRMTEEERLAHVKEVSVYKYSPANFLKNTKSILAGPPPPTYLCNRCSQPGHWFKNCPTLNVKRATGWTSDELVETTADDPLAMLHPNGKYMVPILHQKARQQRKVEANENDPEIKTVPEEFKCPLCKELLKDAVVTICCGESYCAECIQQYLLDTVDARCPGTDCRQAPLTADKLVSNLKVRQAVETFKMSMIPGTQLNAHFNASSVGLDSNTGISKSPGAEQSQKNQPTTSRVRIELSQTQPHTGPSIVFSQPTATTHTACVTPSLAPPTVVSTQISSVPCVSQQPITQQSTIAFTTNSTSYFTQNTPVYPLSHVAPQPSINVLPNLSQPPPGYVPIAPTTSISTNLSLVNPTFVPQPITGVAPQINQVYPTYFTSQPPPPGITNSYSYSSALSNYLPTGKKDAWDEFIERKDRRMVNLKSRRRSTSSYSRSNSGSSGSTTSSSRSSSSRSRSKSRERSYRNNRRISREKRRKIRSRSRSRSSTRYFHGGSRHHREPSSIYHQSVGQNYRFPSLMTGYQQSSFASGPIPLSNLSFNSSSSSYRTKYVDERGHRRRSPRGSERRLRTDRERENRIDENRKKDRESKSRPRDKKQRRSVEKDGVEDRRNREKEKGASETKRQRDRNEGDDSGRSRKRKRRDDDQTIDSNECKKVEMKEAAFEVVVTAADEVIKDVDSKQVELEQNVTDKSMEEKDFSVEVVESVDEERENAILIKNDSEEIGFKDITDSVEHVDSASTALVDEVLNSMENRELDVDISNEIGLVASCEKEVDVENKRKKKKRRKHRKEGKDRRSSRDRKKRHRHRHHDDHEDEKRKHRHKSREEKDKRKYEKEKKREERKKKKESEEMKKDRENVVTHGSNTGSNTVGEVQIVESFNSNIIISENENINGDDSEMKVKRKEIKKGEKDIKRSPSPSRSEERIDKKGKRKVEGKPKHRSSKWSKDYGRSGGDEKKERRNKDETQRKEEMRVRSLEKEKGTGVKKASNSETLLNEPSTSKEIEVSSKEECTRISRGGGSATRRKKESDFIKGYISEASKKESKMSVQGGRPTNDSCKRLRQEETMISVGNAMGQETDRKTTVASSGSDSQKERVKLSTELKQDGTKKVTRDSVFENPAGKPLPKHKIKMVWLTTERFSGERPRKQ